MMSDADATIRHSILYGITKNCHLTGLIVSDPYKLVEDIKNSIFSNTTRWAVEEYLKEINEV